MRLAFRCSLTIYSTLSIEVLLGYWITVEKPKVADGRIGAKGTAEAQDSTARKYTGNDTKTSKPTLVQDSAKKSQYKRDRKLSNLSWVF